MQLSPSAQDMRNLANKLQQLDEYDTHSDTNEPDHEITDSELARLKLALRPLVDDNLQSRFMQVLNKMVSGQPVTFAESKLLTSAFISMADIIATDNSLISRLRKDIRDYNELHTQAPEEEDVASEINPDVNFTDDEYQPK